MNKSLALGHLVAVFTVVIWGTTFVSTKYLLDDFTPVDLLFDRFILGYLALAVIRPPKLHFGKRRSVHGSTETGVGSTKPLWHGACIGRFNIKRELFYAGAGLSGLTIYYLCENIALTYTQAANASVIISTATMFTAIFSTIFLRDGEALRPPFIAGFVTAIVGISLISFSGAELQLNPLGDLLCIGAAAIWGVYSVILKVIQDKEKDAIAVTRHVFFYGIIFMIPAMFVMDYHIGAARFLDPVNLANMLFLGLMASALCFAAWNFAIRRLGVVTSSVYIYLSPVVTMAASYVVLQEVITPLMWLGTILTLAGLVLSEYRPKKKNK